ncbi:tetratricopeptide repeat protein [Halomonas aquatica]|uniref:Tetratricopeptide repeat-containing protein n=1 Tax=Halomonas aquatica TaxID=3151123 RepID=A0ABV1NCT5_9GAMM
MKNPLVTTGIVKWLNVILLGAVIALAAEMVDAQETRGQSSIASLLGELDRHPENLDTRAHLARALSWSGALLEALEQAERVLAIEPKHRQALRVRADASTWNGDFATALPDYRRYLQSYSDTDTLLAYGQALIFAGYFDQASEIASAIPTDVASAGSEVAIPAFKTRFEESRLPALLLGRTHYRDNDDSSRQENRVKLEGMYGNIDLSVLVESVNADSLQKDSEARTLQLGAESRLTDWLIVNAAVGATEVSDIDSDLYAVARLSGAGRYEDLGYRLRLEREVFVETATILSNRIRRNELDLDLDYAISDRLRLEGEILQTHYSDDNVSTEVEITPQVVLRLRDPGIRLGYRRTWLKFDRQSGGGYFDPDHLGADRLMLFTTIYRPRLRGDAELFVGRQSFTRFENQLNQFVAGGSARLDVDLSPQLTLRTEVEGGNFDFRSPSGFTYWLATLNLVVRL